MHDKLFFTNKVNDTILETLYIVKMSFFLIIYSYKKNNFKKVLIFIDLRDFFVIISDDVF